MDKTELMTSINRYVELYYDVELNDDNFISEIASIRAKNSDQMLDEYWTEYEKLTLGSTNELDDVPTKKRAAPAPSSEKEENAIDKEDSVEVYFRGVKF